MPRWIEPLESRRLLSVTVPHGHNRAAHRLDVKTTQVEIEAKIVQVDLKSVRQLGAQFIATPKKEFQQVGAMLRPLSASNKQLINDGLSTVNTFNDLVKNINLEVARDKKAVSDVQKSFVLFFKHPGDSFARGKFSSAVDVLSSTRGVLNGLLSEIPSAQQQIILKFAPIVDANGNIQTRVEAAEANIEAHGQALSDKADQISNDTNQLLNAAEAELQSP